MTSGFNDVLTATASGQPGHRVDGVTRRIVEPKQPYRPLGVIRNIAVLSDGSVQPSELGERDVLRSESVRRRRACGHDP